MNKSSNFRAVFGFSLIGFLAIQFSFSLQCKGEGVKQLRPDSTYSSADLYFESGLFGFYPLFGIQGCAPNYRLYIHVKNPGESILFGMRFPTANVQYNLRKPNGSLAMAGICPALIASQGYIRYYHQATVGPFPSSGGYTPLEYKVTSIADTGNYYFELVNLPPYLNTRVDLWDFQVVSGEHTPAIPSDMIDGRVWSQSWQFNAELAYYRLFNGKFYVYSDDGIVTKLTFNNARVGVFTLFCNPFGTLNTGNFNADRKSQNSNTYVAFPGIAQYKVFLNDPDPDVYPSGVYGQIAGTPYLTDDPAFPVCTGHKLIIVNVNKQGKVETLLTLPYGAPATNVMLYSDVVPGDNSIPWNGLDGQGNPVPDGTLLTFTLRYVNGLTNLPVWDQEQNPYGYGVTLVRPVSPSVIDPAIYWDDTNIDPAYNCPSGTNFTGCTPGQATCHTWSGQDCHDKTINSWWFASTSTVVFTDVQTSTPAIPFGHDGFRCGEGSVFLHATVAPGSTVDWYDLPAGGTPLLTNDTSFFTPSINNTTIYYAEARRISSGCLSPERDSAVAYITGAPNPVIAGTGLLCLGSGNQLYTTEPGMINYAWNLSPGGTIVSGLGTNQLLVSWNAAGQQWVSVNYTNLLGCPAAQPAVLRVIVKDLPQAAGPVTGPSPVCAGTSGAIYSVAPLPEVPLYIWSLPPGAILAAGAGTSTIRVDFPLTASSGNIQVNGENGCGAGPPSPPLYIPVNYTPHAEAGPDTTICQGNPFTITEASADNYASLLWSSDGAGQIAGETTLVPTYYPAPGETGTIHLQLFVYGFSPCNNDSALISLTILPPPDANAGEDIRSCSQSPVNLITSTAQNYSAIYWTTSGSGTFDNPNILHPVYTPSMQDVNSGNVLLTLKAVGSADCANDTSNVLIIFAKQPTVFAGEDGSICEGDQLQLTAASALHCQSFHWTSSGSGTFDDPMGLHPVYTPSASDISSRAVSLVIHGTALDPCRNVTDTLQLGIESRPKAYAGNDGSVCQGGEFRVSGATASGFTVVEWSHTGSGLLSEANTLSPVYQPGAAETGTVFLTLKATGTGSCHSFDATDNAELAIYPPVITDAGPDQLIPRGTTTRLSASATGGAGSFIYRWEPASMLLDPDAGSTETVALTADVTFIVRILDEVTGCEGSDNILVRINNEPNTEECLNIHNVITPNGDGANDLWFIDCIENFPINKVELFNRWGDLVNTFENYNNGSVAWKGTNVKGEMLPDGTYYYVIAIKNGGNHTGWVFIRGGSE